MKLKMMTSVKNLLKVMDQLRKNEKNKSNKIKKKVMRAMKRQMIF